jgi:F-type H+-transporting ATPase subunit a
VNGLNGLVLSEGISFHAPSLTEFFPAGILFEGTPFEMNRIMVIRMIMVTALVIIFWLGTRKMKLVPGRFQGAIEMGLDLVRVNIAEDLLGKKDGRRFLPILTTIFFLVLFLNITGIVPGFNIAGSSVIGIPLVLAVVSYFTFIYAGLKKHPGAFLKNSLFPSGVPKAFYLVVTPIELLSTFILRPVTLTLRLLMNMIVGHLLLVLLFSATHFFVLGVGQWYGYVGGAGTLAFAIAFSLFEILVAVLQAYVFTLLTAVYLQLALAEEH